MSPRSSLLLASIILSLPGFFFIIMTYLAWFSKRHVSGVPFFGGVIVIFVFLVISPVKWPALFGLLDYGVWLLPYELINYFFFWLKNRNKQ